MERLHVTVSEVRLIVATARFFDRELIVASGLAPVQASLGAPRFPLGYELAGSVGMLAPYGLLKIERRREFEQHYRRRLERFGAEKIAAVLQSLAAGYEAPGVVLLCFEDLSKRGQWCHRRVFAAWWEKRTGESVPELADTNP